MTLVMVISKAMYSTIMGVISPSNERLMAVVLRTEQVITALKREELSTPKQPPLILFREGRTMVIVLSTGTFGLTRVRL